MPAYRVRFLVEFVARSENALAVVTEVGSSIDQVYDVTSVAYGDLEITDQNAEPEDGEDE